MTRPKPRSIPFALGYKQAVADAVREIEDAPVGVADLRKLLVERVKSLRVETTIRGQHE